MIISKIIVCEITNFEIIFSRGLVFKRNTFEILVPQ